MIKSQKIKYCEIESYFEEFFNKEGLFFNIAQKRKFLVKIKELSRTYCGNKLVFNFLKRKIEELK